MASIEAEPNEVEPIETFEDLVENKITLWNSAFEQEIDNGQLVSIPLDVAQPAYVKVNDSTEHVVPFSSLNYVHMYKDTNNEIQTYWVTYFPSEEWLNGQRSSYSGLAIVRSWDGGILRVDNYSDGIVDNDTNSGGIQICLIFDNGYRSPISGKKEHCAGCAGGIAICFTIPPRCMLCGDPPIDPPTPVDEPGEGSPDPIQGGGSSNPNTPPPLNCNPDPDYEMPDYPAPDGMEWISPCGDGPTEVPIPQPLPEEPMLSSLMADHGIFLSPNEQLFLEANPILLDKLTSFLDQNNSPEYAELVQWGIMEMSTENITWNQFESGFLTEYDEVQFDLDPIITTDDTWVTNSSYFSYQNLPDLANFKNTYPKNATGNYEMSSGSVYFLVGGDVLQMKVNAEKVGKGNFYQNACALRVCYALLKSGITIPSIPNITFKGAKINGNDTYYFLRAEDLYIWMREEFYHGNRIDLDNSNRGDAEGNGFYSQLGNNEGIYIMIPNNKTTFGATGHAGIYTSPPLTNYYFETAIKNIALWKLN